jgi:glycogen debranching enzyme
MRIHMDRKRLFPLVFLTLILPSPVWAQIAQQSVNYPTRSTTENLAAKRYVTVGDRAYIVGTQDGSFPGMGFHISGHMNGVWAHPLKLLDSYAFFLDGSAFPAATKFTSGPGFVQLDYPATSNGWQISQIEFSPDGTPVALIGLSIHNVSSASANTKLTFQPTSEILPAFPWSGTTPTSNQLDQADLVTFDPSISGLVFQEPQKPWYAVVAGAVKLTGPQDTVQFSGATSLMENLGLDQKNATGQLSWQVTIAPGSTVKIWLAVAGTHTNKSEAYGALFFGLADPQGLLQEKIQSRLNVLAQSDAQIPDPAIQAPFNWAKFNLADMRRVVTDAEILDTNEGNIPINSWPPPTLASFPLLSGFGAGYPDYPWFFGTDGAYTTFGLTATGQWDEAKDHLRTLREVSIAVNGTTGKVLHEIVTTGAIYFGTVAQPGDVQETSQFATAVATLWRWSGDNAFLGENYDFINAGLHYITSALDLNNDGWPEGAGIVEATGMGAEKLDVAVYTIRALNDLEEMAASKGDVQTRNFARQKADQLSRKFDGDWWEPDQGLFADSLALNHAVSDDPGATLGTAPITKLQTFFWINATPMETDIALPKRAVIAFPTLESDRFTELPQPPNDPTSGGFYQQGSGPNITGSFQASAVNTGVMAVAEANYGRMDLSLTYATFIAKELDREQPGALPELFPSRDYTYFQAFTGRAMVMQAWSSYGVEWPVVYYYLGIRPDLPQGEISIIPELPSTWPNLSINNVRIGNGTVSASTSHAGNQYTTTATVPRGLRVHIGYALPANSSIVTVTLNGSTASYKFEDTHRGREVIVTTNSGQTLQLVVTTR